MSNFGELKQVILGCVSRAGSSFKAGSSNFADIAINNALIFAQRQCDFEWNKQTVQVLCNPTGNIMVALDEAGASVKLKRIIKAFGTQKPTGHADVSVPYLSRVSQIADNTFGKAQCVSAAPVAVIHHGQKLYQTPQPTTLPYTLWFEAVTWMPGFKYDSDTNFLLEYGFDFLMYRSILELNFFIKEDERFQISNKMLEESWQSLVTWDSNLISPTETEIDY